MKRFILRLLIFFIFLGGFLLLGKIAEAAAPDLIMQNISVWKDGGLTIPATYSVVGDSLTFSAKVKNQGDASFTIAGGGYLAVYNCIDNPNCTSPASTGYLGGSSPAINSMAAGAVSSAFSSTWSATLGSHTIYFCADPTNKVAESNEANNCGSLTFTVSSWGTIRVQANNNGVAFFGSVSYTLTGPATYSDGLVSNNISRLPIGQYTLVYNSGGPVGATFSSVSPPSQLLTVDQSGSPTITFNINFISPDFSLSATSLTLKTIQTDSVGVDYSITTQSLNGFNAPVSFTVSGLPSGATASWIRNPATPPANSSIVSYLNIKTNNTPIGTYPITITGTNGALTRTATVTLQVFSVSVNLKVATNSSNWSDSLSGNAPLNGVDLQATVTSSIGGTIDMVFDCNTQSSYNNVSFIQTVNDMCNFPSSGTYSARVQARAAGSPWVEDTATITVTLPPAFDFSLSNSGNVTIQQSATGSNTGYNDITATLISGNTEAVSFSSSGLPAGVSGSFNAPSCSPNCATRYSISVTPSAVPGTYPITIRGTASSLQKTTQFNLIINAVAPQNYTCSPKPATGTVWNTVSSYTQTWNGSVWTPADDPTTEYNATASATSCRYTCATNYTWNGSTCAASTRTYSCQAKPATGTSWNTVSSYTQTWNGSSWTPADDPTTEYNATASATSCRYTCATNYTWNGSSCTVNTQTYTCNAKPATGTSWNTVSSYTQTWNGSAWTPAGDASTDYNTIPDTASCRYICATNYSWNGSSCAANTQIGFCTGALPSGAQWNDGAQTDGRFTQTWNGSAWTPASKTTTYSTTVGDCNYTCATNYTWNGSSCAANTRTYTCSAKPATGTSWNTVSSYTQTWNGSAWIPADDATTEYNATPDSSSCRYTCATNYTWNGSSCAANAQLGTCTGALPSGAQWNDGAQTDGKFAQTWNGSAWTPSSKTTTYSTTVGDCNYICATNYTWNGSSCAVNTQTYTCNAKPATGTSWNTVSSYTQTWNGSAWTPAGDATTEYNATASATSCRYTCATNYTWNGSSCAVNTQTYTCNAKPATGTSWNTVSSYTQTWNGSAWTPAGDASTEYNTIPDTASCRYICATNYTWNGSTCAASTRTYTCQAKPATGTSWNTVSSYTQTWNGSAWTPADDATTEYNITASATSCRYTCASGYIWNGSSCVALYTLTVSKNGFGTGTVSGPAGQGDGISCGTNCDETYVYNTSVTLTASPAAGSTFAGWSGACSGTGNCTVVMTQARNVTATFYSNGTINVSATLNSLAWSGSLNYVITGPEVISGASLASSHTNKQVGTYTISYLSGGPVGGILSSITPVSSQTLSDGSAISFTFNFTATYSLIVTKSGGGASTIISNPAGIDCGLTCSAVYNSGTIVRLTANPAAGYGFVGWSGACSGIATCDITMDSVKTVSATFASSPNLPASLTSPNWSYVQASQYGALKAYLKWQFSDPNPGASESAYQIIFNTQNTTVNPIFDTGKCLGYNNPNTKCRIDAGVNSYPVHDQINLSYNTKYYWWVKVWNNYDLESGLKQYDTVPDTDNDDGDPLTFTTYKHEFPEVDFTWSPAQPSQNESAKFSDASKYYSSAAPSTSVDCNGGNCSYLWTIPDDATINNASVKNPQITFGSSGQMSVTLQVTDNDGYFSSITKILDVKQKLPSWQEVKPRQ